MTRKNKKRIEADVTVKEMALLKLIYVRHVGSYAGMAEVFQKLFEKLYAFAGPRGLIGASTRILSVYHDDPGITDEDKLRVDACMTVPEGTEVEGEIGTMQIPGGTFAVGSFALSTDEYSQAWDTLVGGWLPESGYQFDDRLSYELYCNNPEEHPEKKCLVDICIPVKPL